VLVAQEKLDGGMSPSPERDRVVPSGDVYEYLRGIIWNVETYQKGVCADYGFDYGKRGSVSPEMLRDLFMDCRNRNRKLSRRNLGTTFRPPLDSELSLLAATPPAGHNMIDEMYVRERTH